MKRSAKLFLIVGALFCASPLFAQNSIPEIPYDSAANLLKLPDNIYLGEAVGVATNSKGHIFVYTRTGSPKVTIGTNRTFARSAARLFEFDQTGKYLREIGQGLYGFVFAHAVRVDRQDNIWVIDEGSNMIIKFDPENPKRFVFPLVKPPRLGPDAGAPQRRRVRESLAIILIGQPMWPGIQPEISSSRMGMATRGSRSSTRTAGLSNPGDREGPRPDNSMFRMRSQPMLEETSMSVTGKISEFKSSTTMETSRPSSPMLARRTRFALPWALLSTFTLPTRTRARPWTTGKSIR